jgi:hypothetical protein
VFRQVAVADSQYSTDVQSLLPSEISPSSSRSHASRMPRTTQKAQKSTGGPASQVSLAALRMGEMNTESGQISRIKRGKEVSITKTAAVSGVRVRAFGTCHGIAAAY